MDYEYFFDIFDIIYKKLINKINYFEYDFDLR